MSDLTLRQWLLSDAPTSRRQARLASLYKGWLNFRSNTMAMFGLGILVYQQKEQARELENLKRRQRDQYLDLDQRIGAAATGQPAAGAITGGYVAQADSQLTPPADVPEVRDPVVSPSQTTGIGQPDDRCRVREEDLDVVPVVVDDVLGDPHVEVGVDVGAELLNQPEILEAQTQREGRVVVAGEDAGGVVPGDEGVTDALFDGVPQGFERDAIGHP